MAVRKYHDQGNLWNKVFKGSSSFRRWSIAIRMGGMAAGSRQQAGH